MSAPSANIPEKLNVSLETLFILWANFYKASAASGIGFLDCEESIKEFMLTIRNKKIEVPTKDVERLLWACVQLDEQGEFYHYNKTLSLEAFIRRGFVWNHYKFYFDKVYNFFRTRKPKQGVPAEAIIGPLGQGE